MGKPYELKNQINPDLSALVLAKAGNEAARFTFWQQNIGKGRLIEAVSDHSPR